MATITLEALMTAEAILPSAKPSDAAEAFVMIEIISTPGAISRVISQLTAPSTSLVTFPFSILRALICMVGRIVSNGSLHSNRIGIEIETSHHCLYLRAVRFQTGFEGVRLFFRLANLQILAKDSYDKIRYQTVPDYK